MSGEGIFSLGLIGPMAILFLGFQLIGVPFAIVAIATIARAKNKNSGKSHPTIDLSLRVFILSLALSIVGWILVRYGAFFWGPALAIFAIFLLWPISALLALRGGARAGRRILLVGHGLIAILVSLLLSSVLIHYLS